MSETNNVEKVGLALHIPWLEFFELPLNAEILMVEELLWIKFSQSTGIANDLCLAECEKCMYDNKGIYVPRVRNYPMIVRFTLDVGERQCELMWFKLKELPDERFEISVIERLHSANQHEEHFDPLMSG